MRKLAIVASVGYGATSFGLYSGFPTNHWGAPDNDNYITHSGFVRLAVKF